MNIKIINKIINIRKKKQNRKINWGENKNYNNLRKICGCNCEEIIAKNSS